MVDVVTNHMGYAGCGDCVDYSVFNPFNQVTFTFHVTLQFHTTLPNRTEVPMIGY